MLHIQYITLCFGFDVKPVTLHMDPVFGTLLQAVKFEPYHDSALARFLLKRALRVSTLLLLNVYHNA